MVVAQLLGLDVPGVWIFGFEWTKSVQVYPRIPRIIPGSLTELLSLSPPPLPSLSFLLVN